MSTGGSAEGAIAGGRTRRGPVRPNGPACEVNTGSVMRTAEAVRIRNVEWPMNVTATEPRATAAGGGSWGSRARRSGHGVGSRVRIQRTTSRSVRSADRSVLKNRSPSQWSVIGNRGTQNLYTSAVITATSFFFTSALGGWLE